MVHSIFPSLTVQPACVSNAKARRAKSMRNLCSAVGAERRGAFAASVGLARVEWERVAAGARLVVLDCRRNSRINHEMWCFVKRKENP
jgi:hypothetical protein